MVAKVQKWGNSLGVRIPKSFAAEVRVRAGSRVEMSVRNGRLVVRPVKAQTYILEEFVARITPSEPA